MLASPYDPRRVDSWSLGCVALELALGPMWFAGVWLPMFSGSGMQRVNHDRLRGAIVHNLADAHARLARAEEAARARDARRRRRRGGGDAAGDAPPARPLPLPPPRADARDDDVAARCAAAAVAPADSGGG